MSLLRLLRRDPAALPGLVLVGMLLLVALLAPVLTPFDPLNVDVTQRLQPPSIVHWLGTDQLGRDELSRLLYGARVSLFIGLIAVVLASVFGTLVGLVTGYVGGTLDNLLMRLMDAVLAFPGVLLALAIVAALGPGLANTLLAFGIAGIPQYARLLRSVVLSARNQEYVAAARALGVSHGRIMLRHILPNALPPVLIAMTLQTGTVIVSVAGVGYLGLGIQLPTPEWGAMLSGSQALFLQAPWLMFGPGLAILLAVVAFNLLGDALRDSLDPRLRHGV